MGKKKSWIAKVFDPRMILIDFVKLTGAIPTLVDLRLKKIYIDGKKPKGLYKGKYLVSSNHSSFIDPVILTVAFWMRRIGFVATKEIFDIKFWGKFFAACGCIKVDRENVSMKTFKTVTNRLENGHLVGIFPEGYVSNDNEIHGFKSGVVMMSLMSEADILPVYIAKRKNRLHRQVIVFGNKIHLSDYIKSPIPSINEINEVSNILRDVEITLENRYNEYMERKKK